MLKHALREPEHISYDLNLRDITEVWRRGSVDRVLVAATRRPTRLADPSLSKFAGHVSDSGEGRWTIKAAIDEASTCAVSPAPFTSDSAPGEKPISPTNCCPRCRDQFGDTSKKSDTKSKGLKEKTVTTSHSDALVFFGATGDLAYKKIFPGVAAMFETGSSECAGHRRCQS